MACSAQNAHAARVADQDSVGALSGEEAEEIGFAGLLDPRSRQIDRCRAAVRRTVATASAILLDVLVIGVDRRDAEREGRFDLVGSPT